MQEMRISRFTSLMRLSNCLILALVANCAFAQETNADGKEQPKPTKYVPEVKLEQKMDLFQGFAVSADVLGPAIRALSDYGTFEGALRLNLKNTFFPVVEAGYANCDKENDNTHVSYTTSAPFFRAGIDINMLKNNGSSEELK